MTPSPPDEALHFRGKTLTPESPRPLHIPEPASIPVLENQMDPVFNDTSTYDRPEINQTPFQTFPSQDGWTNTPVEAGVGSGQDRHTGSLHDAQSKDPAMMNDISVSAPAFFSSIPAGTEQAGNTNPGLALMDSNPSHAPPVVPVPQGLATMCEIDNANNPANAPAFSGHLEEDLKEEPAVAGSGSGSGSDSATAGVNFQTLLDNLSHPTVATSASTGTVPSLVAEGSSLPKAPMDEPLQPGMSSSLDAQSVNLPARPPLQDPSTHPNYPSHGDPSYHQPPPAQNPAYATEPSNHALQNYPSMPPGGPPGTGSGVGALPPPPIASFQQTQQTTPSSTAESQTSQEGPSQTPKKNRADKPAVRPGKGADDDSPWGPEVQKKYDEFLHDERIYVTEGLWDRFPVGSRLFVGQYPFITPHICTKTSS